MEIVAVGNAVNGSVELSDTGNVVFTPDEGFTGNAYFDYTISDPNGAVSSTPA